MKKYAELEELAQQFTLGTLDTDELKKLNTIEHFTVLALGGLFGCTRLGLISQKKTVKEKYNIIQKFKLFATNLCWSIVQHQEWVERTREASGKITELANALNNRDAGALKIACEVVDLFTKDDVFSRMLMGMEADEGFEADCLQELCKNEKYYSEFYPDMSCGALLQRFFSACKEYRIDALIKELDEDNIKLLCSRKIPNKSDNLKGLAKSYDENFE